MTKEKEPEKTVVCGVCKEQKKMSEVRPVELVREPIVQAIRAVHKHWMPVGYICSSDLARFRGDYVRNVLETEKGKLSDLEQQIMRSLKEHELLSRNINLEFERRLTFGERVADKVAEVAGSWSFIIGFLVVISVWMLINVLVVVWKPFDPYPFILLNLVLSCIAALQAPIIMMSQNRQEARDRMRAEHDYQINLKAELEIRILHEKIDHLLMYQWQRLLEIQEVQMDLMEEIAGKGAAKRGA